MGTIIPEFIDTKTIIVNLLKEDKRNYLSIDRLLELLDFIYAELKKTCKLDEYQIMFDINFDAIERTVRYNNNIFRLDIDGERIYLRTPDEIDNLVSQYQVDDTIHEIIRRYAA